MLHLLSQYTQLEYRNGVNLARNENEDLKRF